MPRTTPEKLAQALRANLRRRKAGPPENAPKDGLQKAVETPETSPEKPRPKEG